jgi:hypothetical protein
MSELNDVHPYEPYHPLFGCQLKIRRAQVHLSELGNAIEEFVGSKPYESIHDFESEPGHHLARFNIAERPPLWWSPIIGDVVHNLRSALDHLAWQLVIRNGRNPESARSQFPIFTRDPFDLSAHDSPKEAKRARDAWRNQTRGMHRGDIKFLKGLQPYDSPDPVDEHPLARLNQFSNWDKHREFHFPGQVFMDYRFGATMKDVRITLLYLKPRGEALEDGEVIASYGVVATGDDPKLNMNPKIFFDVSFGEGSPLEGLGIKKTLPTLFTHVQDIILAFKERFDNQDFSPPSDIQTSRG